MLYLMLLIQHLSKKRNRKHIDKDKNRNMENMAGNLILNIKPIITCI